MVSGKTDSLFRFIQANLLIKTGLSDFITLTILCVIITLPRLLPFPPLFLTYDEILIGQWTSEMTQAFLTGNWQGTVNNAYPAVPLMWLDTAQVGLARLFPNQMLTSEQMLTNGVREVFASLPQRRLALAVTNSIILMLAFGLLRRLYNNFVAVTAIILMALDPFPLTQARVFRTEGLNTGLMLLSALAIILYAKERRAGWLVASGILAGWAILTKFTSIYLLPFTGLTLLVWPYLKHGSEAHFPHRNEILGLLKSVMRDTLAWGLMMGLTVFVCWPALWVSPVQAFNIVFGYLHTVADKDLIWGNGVFFQGRVIHGDPGLSFYLWLLAYRTTPIVWLGLVIALGWSATFFYSQWHGSKPRFLEENGFLEKLAPTLLFLAYAIFYLVGMSLGTSKVDRYLQPIFPAMSILAALGFLLMAKLFSAQGRMTELAEKGIWGTVLVGSLWMTIPHHPYYFTYWNPLLGGGQTAVKRIPVGSLEGVDILLDHLQALPNVHEINLAGAGEFLDFCLPTFKGNCLDGSEFLASDYFINSATVVQRQLRFSNIQSYVPDVKLVKKYTKDGVDYAWLYKMPGGFQLAPQWLGAHGQFMGYRMSAASVGAGDPLEVTMFWLNGKNGWTLDDSEFFIKLLDKTGRVQQIVPAQLKPEFIPYLSQPGEALAFTASFDLPLDIAVGVHTLEIGLRVKATGEETWRFSLADQANTITVNRGARHVSADSLPIQHRLKQAVGEAGLFLLGYNNLTHSQTPGFDLYWQAEKPLTENYLLDLTLLDSNGQVAATWQRSLAPDIQPLTAWQPGEIVKLTWPLESGHTLPPDFYQPVLSIFPANGRPDKPLAQFRLLPSPEEIPLVRPAVNSQHSLEVTFGQHLDLLGYDLSGKKSSSGGSLFVSLYWLNRYPLQKAEAEIQILNDKSEIIGQQILPVPAPTDFPKWQSVSYYELPLANLPTTLIIRSRPIGAETWYKVQAPDQPGAEQVVIDDILHKIAVVQN